MLSLYSHRISPKIFFPVIFLMEMSFACDRVSPQAKSISAFVASYKWPLVFNSLSRSESFWSNFIVMIFFMISIFASLCIIIMHNTPEKVQTFNNSHG